MKEREHQGVWVFAEVHAGHLTHVVLELMSKARDLASRLDTYVAAILIGEKLADLVGELQGVGADRLYLAEDPQLAVYDSDRYSRVLKRLVEEHKPEILLLGATRVGLDLAPCVAARLETGLSAHCIDLDIDDAGRLVQYVPAFGQMSVVRILCPERNPQVATVVPGVFPVRTVAPAQTAILRVRPEVGVQRGRVTLVDHGVCTTSMTAELGASHVVVVGGAGIGSAEGWRLLEDFADAVGGAVGATRPAVDEGWAKPSQMIGHSGTSVGPRLYVGVGVSGDMLHMIGVSGAQVSVAINNDRNAPIFRQVDYGIVGDYREILPLLMQGLEHLA